MVVDLTKQLDMEKKKNEKNKENISKLEEEHKELKKVKFVKEIWIICTMFEHIMFTKIATRMY